MTEQEYSVGGIFGSFLGLSEAFFNPVSETPG